MSLAKICESHRSLRPDLFWLSAKTFGHILLRQVHGLPRIRGDSAAWHPHAKLLLCAGQISEKLGEPNKPLLIGEKSNPEVEQAWKTTNVTSTAPDLGIQASLMTD